MGIDKFEQARREGMSYALRVAKEKGIDGLEKELEFRNAAKVPLNVSKAKFDEFVNNVKNNTVDTVLILASVTLRDEFGFAKERLNRFISRFNEKAECIAGDYCTWEDNIELLREECGLDMTIRHNDKNVRV